MANSLLDFVMSLVRDPTAAARYAADPAGAISAAHLAGVTSADVNNLIPMVADSLSMAAPAFGPGGGQAVGTDGNVWTTGAAAAAFDSFDVHLSDPATPGSGHTEPAVIAPHAPPGHPPVLDPAADHLAPVLTDPAASAGADGADRHLPVDPALEVTEHQHPEWDHPQHADHPGFDLF